MNNSGTSNSTRRPSKLQFNLTDGGDNNPPLPPPSGEDRGSRVDKSVWSAVSKSATLIPATPSKSRVKLQRNIGYIGCCSFIMGTIIGSGIFISPGGIIGSVKNVWVSLMVWCAGGLVATLGAVVFIELSTVVPASGGEYAYMLNTYGPIPAFLTAWSMMMLVKPSAIAILFLTCAQNILEPIGRQLLIPKGDPDFVWATKCFCIFLVYIFTTINSLSVKLSSKMQVIFTGVKLFGLLLIIISGIVNLGLGRTEAFTGGFEDTEYNSIPAALFASLWAYDAWDMLNWITEEIEDPYRNVLDYLQRTLIHEVIMSIFLACIIYMLVNVAYLTQVTPLEFADPDNTVGYLYGQRTLGVFSFIMPIVVALSTAGSGNGALFTCSRMTLVASRNGHLPRIVSFVHAEHETPMPALIQTALVTTFMVVFLNIPGLIDFFSYSVWIMYGATAACHIVLRFKKPDAPRPFKVPMFFSVLLILASLFLVIGTVVLKPKLEYLYSVAFSFSGIFFYVIFVHCEIKFPGTDHFTTFVQILLNVVPPSLEPEIEEELDKVLEESKSITGSNSGKGKTKGSARKRKNKSSDAPATPAVIPGEERA